MSTLGNAAANIAAVLNTPLMQAVAPALIAGAFLYAAFQWLPTTWRPLRALVTLLCVLLMGRYLLWRYQYTLPPMSEPVNWIAGWLFIIIETLALASAAIGLLFLSRVRDRSAEADVHEGWERGGGKSPLIDVLICTYNEEQRIVERTIIGAIGMDYPSYRVWVLDDGKRPWLAKLCRDLGAGYIARPDNTHAKAGNINHALGVLAELPEPPQFVSILDADFVPTERFLSRAMALFHDPDVGVVQTPQHFINPDPIQTNLAVAGTWPDEQRFFFDIVMPAKDAWGCAFCCGTSSIIRFDGLRAIGGFPTDSVTEDYLLTLRLKETGLTTAYLNEPLTFGLAPEGLKEYVTQRGRWCLGFMQIVRGRSGPFSSRRLGFVDRLSLTETFLNWSFVYLYKFAGILVPVMYLLLGIKAVQVSLLDMLAVFLPFYAVQAQAMGWLSRGRVVPILTDVAQLLTAPAALKAVAIGLLRPKGQKFSVTAKGGDRSVRFLEWPLLRIFLSLLILSLVSVLVSFTLSNGFMTVNESALALVWSWYNIATLALLCIICIEQPRRRRAGRFPTDYIAAVFIDGERRSFRMRDVSVSGAQFAGNVGAAPGTHVLVRVGSAHVPASIVRAGSESFAVRFDQSLRARIVLVRHIYSGIQDRAIRQVQSAPLMLALFRRVMK